MIRFNERSREFARAQNHISQVIKEFVQYRKNGFTSGEFVLSCLVSDGQLQREEALDIIRHKSEILDHEPPGLQDFLEAIHMGSDDFERILTEKSSYRPPWYHGERSALG
jgi:hypothetical protein